MIFHRASAAVVERQKRSNRSKSSRTKTAKMNRFEFVAAVLIEGETVVVKHDSVKLYDGNEKVMQRFGCCIWIGSLRRS